MAALRPASEKKVRFRRAASTQQLDDLHGDLRLRLVARAAHPGGPSRSAAARAHHGRRRAARRPDRTTTALEGRRTSHGGRVGLAVELTARGASTHAIQIAGGWKGPAMVVRYAASISTREGAVSKYLR